MVRRSCSVLLSVPAIEESELQRSFELKDGSSAVYTLTDEEGHSAGTQPRLSGSEINLTRYMPRAY